MHHLLTQLSTNPLVSTPTPALDETFEWLLKSNHLCEVDLSSTNQVYLLPNYAQRKYSAHDINSKL